ncbi:YqgE/AlgH family protein [Marinoscillum sp. MHG1-6]|uniref:YqgE/AlgH family protein n=1 Tax=Marinoscillum sp. MHG1-6 TaxID=2959627 RepID=UPI0021583BC3|nr:YqgE/AlgH family protein [Marinoscillum sp. MHG1-6]
MDYFVPDHITEPKRGDLLISEPYLPDPNFERTVIYLCEHDENGSFGFVLNKKSPNNLEELIGIPGFEGDVYVGGPVQQDTLHFLHRDTLMLEPKKEIANGICWGIDFDGLLGSVENKVISPKDVRFFVGYSGWSDGQLMGEIEARSWIVYQNAPQELVFDVEPGELWKRVLQEMGGKFKVISNYPLDPRLN